MKLKLFGESDMSSAVSCSTTSSSGINTSVGSGIINYGPNDPRFSNLAEYKRKDSKNAGHSRKQRHNKNSRFHEPEGW